MEYYADMEKILKDLLMMQKLLNKYSIKITSWKSKLHTGI